MPEHELGRKHQRLGAPRQRHVPQREHADRRDGEDRERDHRPPRQDRRGDGHRRQDQDRERVLQPAGQIQQDGELQDVVAETERGIAFAEPGRRLAQQDQHKVEQHRAGDDAEGRNERQAETEPVMDDQDRQRLSGDRDPADQDQRAQADPAESRSRARSRLIEAGVAHLVDLRDRSSILAVSSSEQTPALCWPNVPATRPYRGDGRARRRSRQSRQALSDRRRGRRDQLYRRARRHRGVARRQRRRQDDDPVDPARPACCRPPAGCRCSARTCCGIATACCRG